MRSGTLKARKGWLAVWKGFVGVRKRAKVFKALDEWYSKAHLGEA